MKRGGAVEEEEEHQADSIYRGGEWLEGVSGRRAVGGPPLVKRVDSEDSAADRIPDIVTGVVMTYSFMQVLSSFTLVDNYFFLFLSSYSRASSRFCFVQIFI